MIAIVEREGEKQARAAMAQAIRKARGAVLGKNSRRVSGESAVILINKHLRGKEISPDTYYKIEQGKAPISLDVVRAAQAAFDPESKSLIDLYRELFEHPSDNLPEEGASAEAATIPGYIRVVVASPSKLPIWSVKGIARVIKLVRSFLGASRRYYQVPEHLGRIKKGMVLAFTRGDVPPYDTYLLYSRRNDADTEGIFTIDASDPLQLRTCDGQEVNGADWEYVGWAEGVAWGHGDTLDNFFVLGAGIGPRSTMPF